MTFQPAGVGDSAWSARCIFRRTAQAGAIGCATFLFCGILFVAAVHPSLLRCSTWLMPVRKGAWAPAWMLAPMVALWAVSMCFGAVRWGWFARVRARNVHLAPARAHYTLTIDFGWPVIIIIAASGLLCATPILMAIASCYPG